MSNNTAAYSRAIDLLLSDQVDYKQVVVELAKKHPTIFVRLVDGSSPVTRPRWHRRVNSLIQSVRKIDAIRLIREETGLGLREAKDIADNVQHELYVAGRNCEDYAQPARLDAALTRLVGAIVLAG